MKVIIFGPAGLILLGAVISGVGAFWAAFQQVGFERELRVRSDKIAELSQDAVHSVTGGESFCYFEFMDSEPGKGELLAIHKGSHPIYDVEARVADLDRRTDRIVNVGNLPPGLAQTGIAPWHEAIPGQLRLNIFFTARNGAYTQLYRRVRVKDGWATAIRVDRKGKIVLEEVSADFPRNEKGEVDW